MDWRPAGAWEKLSDFTRVWPRPAPGLLCVIPAPPSKGQSETHHLKHSRWQPDMGKTGAPGGCLLVSSLCVPRAHPVCSRRAAQPPRAPLLCQSQQKHHIWLSPFIP